MGGGDLNMKKSWHPLLRKNQERVWLEEKKALEEKKKLDQLRKEKEEERQLQELQRLQEEQTGRKKSEKLDWMYSTPATGSSANQNDLEDYLLGKKRVDKILTANENAKIGAAHKDFIAVQNANTARDIAAKIREDPLLAIKQQEQAAYQALMSNPLRLKEMQLRNGIKPKEKKEKKDKKSKKEKHSGAKDHSRHDERSRRRSHSLSRDRNRSLPRDSHSPPPSRSRGRDRSRVSSVEPRRRRSVDDRRDNTFSRDHRDDDGPGRDRFRYSRRGRSGSRDLRRDDQSSSRWPMSDETSSEERRRSRSPERRPAFDDRKRRRSRTPPHQNKRPRPSPPPAPTLRLNEYSATADERAARLAAMTNNASSMTVDRKERLATLLAQEKAEIEAEERARAKSRGMGGFLSAEQKKVFGGASGLEDRIKRGRGGMIVDAD